MSEPRLLLLEFLARDPFSQRRSELYPFIRGYAMARGVPVRWVYALYDPAALPAGPYRMLLADEDAGRLVALLHDFAPTHVLLNEELDTPLAKTITTAAPAARRRFFGLEDEPYALEMVAEWDRWLEQRPAARDASLLPDEFVPDYDCEGLGDAPGVLRSILPVIGGTSCLYHRPVARNPLFEGVDLTGATSLTRCSFCSEPPKRAPYPYRLAPVKLALRQIREARRTAPPPRNTGEFFLSGGVHFARLNPLCEALLAEKIPPSTLHFSCRIDEVLRKRAVIDRLLPRLREAGHALSVTYVGVENFSPTENRRLNKGIEPAQVEAFYIAVTDWERAFPDTFLFHAHGGFGFILFTPWTRTEDLRLNLAAAKRHGLPPGSFFFVSRVQLLPDLPITRLAERDGLVAPAFNDQAPGDDPLAAFDSGCLSSAHDYEVPWRFAQPNMAAIYALFASLRQRFVGTSPVGAGERLAALLEHLPEEMRSPYRFLPEVLDTADAHPDIRRAGALLDRVEARLHEIMTRTAGSDADEQRLDEVPEWAGLREQRDWLESRLRDMLGRMLAHRARPLRGFEVREVTTMAEGTGWGQLRFRLARGDDRLTFYILPRGAVAHAFVETAHFAWLHDSDTPVDTEEKRDIARLLARAFERHSARR